MEAQVTKRGTEVEAGQSDVAATPAAPQAGVAPAPGAKYVVGDPRESEEVFDKFADLLKAAYYESVERGAVIISFYEDEDEVWPLVFILTQPFATEIEDYVVLMNEDRAPLHVFDLGCVTWREVADGVLYLATKDWENPRIAKIEIEVAERW
jgi:hypothetical protein